MFSIDSETILFITQLFRVKESVIFNKGNFKIELVSTLEQKQFHIECGLLTALNSYLRLLIRNPALHHISLPDKLQKRRIINQPSFPGICFIRQRVHLIRECLTLKTNGVGVVVALRDQGVTVTRHLVGAVAVHFEVRLEGVVLLQQTLLSGVRNLDYN